MSRIVDKKTSSTGTAKVVRRVDGETARGVGAEGGESDPREPAAAVPDLSRARRLGHRVTPEMVGGPTVGRSSVRRTMKRWKPKAGEPVPDEYADVDAKADEVDKAVDTSYAVVAQQLKDGQLDRLPGVSLRRHVNWLATMADARIPANRKAAAAGYIIEDNATAGFAADPMVDLQVTGELRNSRPDVVIRDVNKPGIFKPTGYLDITSSGDAGHIFDKQGNWGTRPYVAESLYPSFDFSNLAAGPVNLSADDLQQIEDWRLARAQAKWVQVQEAFERGQREYRRKQVAMVDVLERWTPDQRLKLRNEVPLGRRGRSPGVDSVASLLSSRKVGKYQFLAKKRGIKITEAGEIETVSYEAYLDKRNIAYTWDHVKELYGL